MKDNGKDVKDRESEEGQKFLEEFLKKLEEDPKSLNAVEKKLGERYLLAQQRASGLAKSIQEMETVLAKSRMEMNQELGKATGILESVLAVRE